MSSDVQKENELLGKSVVDGAPGQQGQEFRAGRRQDGTGRGCVWSAGGGTWNVVPH